MTRRDKDLNRILDARNDANVDFDLLVRVMRRLGFDDHMEGSHLICSHPRVPRNLSLQPQRALAKPYQVRQARHVILALQQLEPNE